LANSFKLSGSWLNCFKSIKEGDQPMVVIRLARGGAKKRPFYHIVAADKRRARDSKYIERLGYFNPISTEREVGLLIERERITHWVSKGAQLSDKVQALVKQWDKKEGAVA